MPDNLDLHIGENSPEQVALKLLELVAIVERKDIRARRDDNIGAGLTMADRKWLLETYSECIEVVKAHRMKPAKWPSQGG